MDKNYELFIEQLTNGIHNFADIPLENIEFTNKEGDRLNITFAEHDDAYEVCSVHVDELYTAYQDGLNLTLLSIISVMMCFMQKTITYTTKPKR